MNRHTILVDLVEQSILALPATPQRQFACRTARVFLERVRAAGISAHPSSWAALAVAERYAVGQATVGELDEARLAVLMVGNGFCHWVAGTPAPNAAIRAARYGTLRSPPTSERARQLQDLLEVLAR